MHFYYYYYIVVVAVVHIVICPVCIGRCDFSVTAPSIGLEFFGRYIIGVIWLLGLTVLGDS